MPYTLTEAKRKKYLSFIHLQKAKAHLDDEAYVTILYSCAAVDSAAKITTVQQFETVITALNNVLTAQGQAPLGDRAYVPHAASFLHAVKDPHPHVFKIAELDRIAAALKSVDRGFIYQRRHSRAAKAHAEAAYFVDISAAFDAVFVVRKPDENAPIKASRAQQRVVDQIYFVSRADYHHAAIFLKSVHLGQQLI